MADIDNGLAHLATMRRVTWTVWPDAATVNFKSHWPGIGRADVAT
jgi:hypothetical protein